jgi:hypothetical protein
MVVVGRGRPRAHNYECRRNRDYQTFFHVQFHCFSLSSVVFGLF